MCVLFKCAAPSSVLDSKRKPRRKNSVCMWTTRFLWKTQISRGSSVADRRCRSGAGTVKSRRVHGLSSVKGGGFSVQKGRPI